MTNSKLSAPCQKGHIDVVLTATLFTTHVPTGFAPILPTLFPTLFPTVFTTVFTTNFTTNFTTGVTTTLLATDGLRHASYPSH